MSASSDVSVPAAQTVTLRQWVAVLGSVLGAFMAVLDIQITNASLADITGSLAATLDDGAWISTAYLVAEIVVIPLTAWLSGVFGMRRYLIFNAVLFLIFSVTCAFAKSLPEMIIFRALQGFTGGVLIPMSFTIILRLLPPVHRPTGFALFGITATFAPSVGPTIGGWLTELYGWPSIFYLNLVPGVLLIAAIWWGLNEEPVRLEGLKKGDWWGIITMAVGLGSLTIFLEEGNKDDWFGSDLICRLAVIAVVSLVAFVIIEMRQAHPLVNLRLFGRRNFGFASLTNIALGVGLYSSSYLIPVYLSQIQGYNSTQIGETVMWAGWPQLLLMPLVAKVFMPRFDARLLVCLGMALFGGSAIMNAWMSHDTAHDQLITSQLMRALGQPLVMVPLTAIATANIEAEQAANASALFNMMRNLGGSMGIALFGTLLSVRERFHSFRIGESVSEYSPATQIRLSELVASFVQNGADSFSAMQKALASLAGTVRHEAFVMAFDDCFLVMGGLLLVCGATIWFCRKAASGGAVAAH